MTRPGKLLVTFFCTLSFTLFSSVPSMLSERPLAASIVNPINSEYLDLSQLSFLGRNSWNIYTQWDEEELKNLKIKTAKAIFVVIGKNKDYSYLVSVKKARSGDHKKDGKWEFPGGKLNKHETVFKALQREVGEEDDSSVLTRQIMQVEAKSPKSLCYKVVELKKKDRQAIFIFLLGEEDYQKIKRYHEENDVNNHEIYHFELIHEENLDTARKQNEKLWTPKSLKILQALAES